MNRNGKTPRAAGNTLTLVESPSEVAGSPSEPIAPAPKTFAAMDEPDAPAPKTLATADEPDAPAPKTLAAADEPVATPSQRRVAAFRANASIAQRLAAAQLAIDAVLSDAALQARLAAYGYDAARMQQGQALRDQAQTLQQQQRARAGEAYSATETRASAQGWAHATYMRHVGVARVALRADRGAMQKLGVVGPRETTQAGWLLQARQFYANALADTAILGALASYQLTAAQLEEGQRQVAAVAAGALARQASKGAAQEATQARDAALQALNRWMQDFMAIARIALADQPQRLEQLGVVA